MNSAAVLCVGEELVLGEIDNTNSTHIATALRGAGWPVSEIRAVGDDLDRIVDALRALARAHAALVVTGGLGPTEDDLTRRALAQAVQAPLREDPEALRGIEARFATLGRTVSARNRIQAMLPAGARALHNPMGTAPGIALTIKGCPTFALPGVPREMAHMLAHEVIPALGPGPRGAVVVRTLHLWGLPESEVGERLADLMARGREPAVGTRVQDSIITVRIVACGADPAQAQTQADAHDALVRSRVGDAVFARDGETLAETVVRLLADRAQTLAVAESCTGGLVGKLITDVPGASAVFREGFVTYTNEAKVGRVRVPPPLLSAHGAVSEPVARALAEGARSAAGADYGLGITGIAGPTGGTPRKPVGLVHVAASGPGWTDHRANRYHTDRKGNRTRAAYTALGLLWRRLRGD